MCLTDEADVLPHDGSSLGHFDSSRRTIVVMHGFSQNGYDSAKEMRDGDHDKGFLKWALCCVNSPPAAWGAVRKNSRNLGPAFSAHLYAALA